MTEGTSIIRTTVASSSTATARVTPSSVGGIGPGDAEGDEHHDHDQRGVGDGSAGAGDALADRELGVAGGFVALTDRSQQEQLVVHRQAEEQGEEEQRRPRVDRRNWPRSRADQGAPSPSSHRHTLASAVLG